MIEQMKVKPNRWPCISYPMVSFSECMFANVLLLANQLEIFFSLSGKWGKWRKSNRRFFEYSRKNRQEEAYESLELQCSAYCIWNPACFRQKAAKVCGRSAFRKEYVAGGQYRCSLWYYLWSLVASKETAIRLLERITTSSLSAQATSPGEIPYR